MNIVRRFTTSVATSFDWVINQIENHEALVNSSIKDAQAACCKAQAQLGRVKTDGQRMRQRLGEVRNAIVLWEERAKSIATEDRQKALECLKRKKRLTTELENLEIEERRHAQLERQFAEDISALQERVLKLKEKRNLMRTRESRASAAKILGESDDQLFAEIDGIFERWETKVSEFEISGALRSPIDELDQEFVTEEESQDLSAELDALMAGK